MTDVFVSKENITDSVKPALIEPKNLPLFSSFSHMPEGIRFEYQEADEKIILFMRAHFITNVSWMILAFILLILPIILFNFTNMLNSIETIVPFRYIVILVSFYYLIVVGYIYNCFIIWFYNIGIVSTKQIIDIDFTDIMYRDVAKARIQEIVDIEYKQAGFMHNFFDYGDLFIQTEGIKPNFEFNAIPHPDKTATIILDLKKYNKWKT
jgi:hypothetical protein